VSWLVDDPRFASNPDRVANRDDLRPLLQNHLGTRDAKDWQSLFLEAGFRSVTCARWATSSVTSRFWRAT
jgi:crotonobetainyl-CoA:carnitine CoA-transferase CaiB-like acyl-CoA transferase